MTIKSTTTLFATLIVAIIAAIIAAIIVTTSLAQAAGYTITNLNPLGGIRTVA